MPFASFLPAWALLLPTLGLMAAMLAYVIRLNLRLGQSKRVLEGEIRERRRAEEKLAENENHLRQIIASEPECVKLQSLDGILLEMNPAGLNLVEAGAPGEIIGTSVYNIIAPEFRGDYRALSERVLDVRMPGMSGMELQEHLNTRDLCLPVIVVTGHGDIPMAVRAMRGGAVDFLQKPYNDQIMLDRIQQALEMCRQRRREHVQLARIQAAYRQLTPREGEVAALVVTGKANKVIAIALGLSHKTVESHRANVMEKMRASSLSELVRMFVRLGLVTDEDILGAEKTAGPAAYPRASPGMR